MSDDEQVDETLRDHDLVRCWCGAIGTYEELFGDDLDESCGGTGYLNCYCGGDFCVCHNHGETQCPGCPDCEDNEDDYGYVEANDDY